MNQGSGPSTVPISYSLPSTGPQRERSRSRERIAQSIDPRLAARGQQSTSSSSSSSLNISNYSSIAPTSSSHIPDAFSQLRNLAEKHGGNIQFPFQQQQQSLLQLNSSSTSSSSSSSTSSNRPFRRIYIGNIPQDCRDTDLKIFLTSCIKACNPSIPDDMISSVTVNNDKKYAFAEFRSPELTTSVLEKLSGLIFMGSQLRFNRPKDASGLPPPPPGQSISLDVTQLVSQGILALQTPTLASGNAAGMSVATSSQPDKRFHSGEIFERFGPIEKNVADQPGKIFCGGLPYNLTDIAVLEIFRAFGEVKSFHLVRDPPDSPTHKGYCFIAYHDDKQTDHVIASFNGMFIGDKALTVRRSNLPAGSGTSAPGAKTPTAPIIQPYGVPQSGVAITNTYVGGGPGGAYSGSAGIQSVGYNVYNSAATTSSMATTPYAPIAPLAPPPVISSRTIQLQNVPLGDDDFATKDSFDGLVEEMREELKKYGNITLMHIPRGGPHKGDVFAQYSSPQEAAVARKELQGRSFAGKIVSCVLVQDDRIRQVSLLAPVRHPSWGPIPKDCL